MIFRRVEKVKICRHREDVTSDEEARNVFESLLAHSLRFSVKVSGVARTLEDCSVLSVSEGGVDIRSRASSLRVSPSFSDVEELEVVYNRGLTSCEEDSGGRWARVIM